MRDKLSLRELLMMGGGLFSMHFGASCMLYPVTWGKEAGSAVFVVYLGIFFSGILLPFLGYFALVKGKGNFLDITLRLSPKFGLIFVAVSILLLGPIFVTPRMSAAAWSAVEQLTGMRTHDPILIVLFNIFFYLLVYKFVSVSGKVVGRVGKVFFPILVAIVVLVILKNIITPIAYAWTQPEFSEPPVMHGFLQGYATGDLQCSLMFGLVVVQGIRNAGIKEKNINKNLLCVGFTGLGILALAHLGHMIAGANLGGTIDLTYSALYTQMVLELFGKKGGIFFAFALLTAALTASIGAISSTSEIWVKICRGKISYKIICLISCVISCVISISGLDAIIEVISPVLSACYPATIILTILYCFDKKIHSLRHMMAGRASFIAAFGMGVLNLLFVYDEMFGLGLADLRKIYLMIPLAKYTLAWIPVSIFVYVFVYVFNASVIGKTGNSKSID